ncbi:MAG TPA: hypothetical protein VHU83_11615 [Bryobacteraceae bacterium]|jgi:hypothetical protein|nr:hypothetical protein [Bryobacteraceae bacterium]
MQNHLYHSEILAPPITDLSIWMGGVSSNERRYTHLLRSAQQLRARCYLVDGAIRPEQVLADGRFVMPDDEQSWHFLVLTNDDRVVGCVRYSLFDPQTVSFRDLRISELVRFADKNWSRKLIAAVQADLMLAHLRGSFYAELGGWAIAKEYRGTKLALETVLASFAWGALVRGGCICSCTATVRHGSASILRRIGGRPIGTEESTLPSYWDPRYACEMEALRFDSREVEPRYRQLVLEMQSRLQGRAVLQADNAANEAQFQASLANLHNALQARGGAVPFSSDSGVVLAG